MAEIKLIQVPKKEADLPISIVPFAPTATGQVAQAAAESGVPGIGFQPDEDPMTYFEDYLNKYYQNPYVVNNLAALEKAQSDAAAAQLQGIRDMRKTLENYTNLPASYDLSPLMNLVDTWTGSRLSAGYARPETPQQRLASVSNIQGGIQKGMADLADTNRQAVKDKQATFNTIAQLAQNAYLADMRMKTAGIKRTSPEKAAKQNVEFGRAFTKDIVEPAVELAQYVAELDKADKILAKWGNTIPPFDSPEWAQYKAAVANAAVIHNKRVAQLGALAGGDLRLILAGVGGLTGGEQDSWLSGEMKAKFQGTVGARRAMSDAKRIALEKLAGLEQQSDILYKDQITELRNNIFKERVPRVMGIYGGTSKTLTSDEEAALDALLGK